MDDDKVTVMYRWTANEGKLDELQQAARQMGLPSQFAPYRVGFERVVAE